MGWVAMCESGTAGEQEAAHHACFGDRGSRCDGAPAWEVEWAGHARSPGSGTLHRREEAGALELLGKTIGWTRTRSGQVRDFRLRKRWVRRVGREAFGIKKI
jgi:hypothetical protein